MMALILQILIYALLGIGVLLFILLLTPVGLSFIGEYFQGLRFQVSLTWAGGLFRLEMMHSQGKNDMAFAFLGIKKTIEARGDKKDPSPKKKPESKKKDTDSRDSISSYLNRQLFAAVKNLLGKLVKALHLKLNVSGIYGFDDPSLTGMIMGILASMNLKDSTIDLNPDFTREVLNIRGSFSTWMIPLHIAALGIGFLFKKSVRALWWPKIKFMKKKNYKEAVKYA